MKLQVLVDDQDKGTVELTGPGILPYAGVVSTFHQLVCDIYGEENAGSPDYLTVGGADVSLRSKARASRRRKA